MGTLGVGARGHGKKECLRQKEQDKQESHRNLRTQKERSVYSQKLGGRWF